MFPGLGWAEIFFIMGVAIVVVGPKDLPRLMRNLGRFMGKARGIAREFQQSFEDIAREADLEDLRKETGQIMRTFKEPLSPGPSIPLTPEEESKQRAAVNERVMAAERVEAEAAPAPAAEQAAEPDAPAEAEIDAEDAPPKDEALRDVAQG